MSRRVLRTQPVQHSDQHSGLGRFPFKLALLLAAAIFISVVVTNSGAEAEMLFQSPASPVDGAQPPAPPPEPPAPPQPPAQPPPAPEPVQPAPTLPPPAPIEQPPAQPAAPQPQQPAGQQPAQQQPGAEQSLSPVATAAPGAAQPAQAQPPAPPPLPEPTQASGPRRLSEPAADPDSQNLVLDEAELIDTVVVSTAYIWLCCGIIIILLIPLIFLFLQIRGRSKLNKLNRL